MLLTPPNSETRFDICWSFRWFIQNRYACFVNLGKIYSAFTKHTLSAVVFCYDFVLACFTPANHQGCFIATGQSDNHEIASVPMIGLMHPLRTDNITTKKTTTQLLVCLMEMMYELFHVWSTYYFVRHKTHNGCQYRIAGGEQQEHQTHFSCTQIKLTVEKKIKSENCG